jgi:hypothetical protein
MMKPMAMITKKPRMKGLLLPTLSLSQAKATARIAAVM